LYRRLANLSDEAGVAAMGAELADRFGPLPRPVENLLYQLRVKIRAGQAGALSVASENGQIVVTLPPVEDGDYSHLTGTLDPHTRMSKNKIWLPRASNEKEWRGQLLEALAQLGSERSLASPA
jgi:transcription-repair coupling factor (superfamily II helicase)